MRFSVFLKEQDPAQDGPKHETSREFALVIVCVRDARVVGQNAIQLTTSESWRELKSRLRGRKAQQEIAKLLPPLDHYLAYNYPLPYALLKMYRHL